MTLLIILLVISLQRYTNIVRLMNDKQWQVPYFTWVQRNINKIFSAQNLLEVIIILLPIVLFVAIVDIVLHCFWHGVLALVWHFIILLYCLDAQNFREQLQSYFNKIKLGDSQAIYLNSPFLLSEEASNEPPIIIRALTRKIFSHANSNIFCVLFWFILLGPTGAILFYTANHLLLAKQKTVSFQHLEERIQDLMNILYWLPVRVIGLSYGLVGHFISMFNYWKQHVRDGIKQAQAFGIELGLRALQIDEQGLTSIDVSENWHALDLIDRALVLWLVLLAIFSLGLLF